jgi:hypothetical protein
VAVGGRIRIEALRDPAQLVNGAAEALPVLLGELGTLRGDHASN